MKAKLTPRRTSSWKTLFAMAGMSLAMAATLPAEVLFSGSVKTEKGEPIAGVRVALEKAKVSGETDAQGKFTLHMAALPVAPDKTGTFDFMTMTRDGMRDRLIRIRDAGYFKKSPEEKMERRPAGADVPGFTTLMPLSAAFIDPVMRVNPKAPAALTLDQLKDLLAKTAAESRKAVPDGETSFYAWVPPGLAKVKVAVLISLHGIGSVDEPVLRTFATKHDAALVGVLGDPIQRGCYPLELMDEPLRRLGQLVKHPELSNVPVLTFGHSNGTGFATVYAVDRPERLLGWVSYHSGWDWQLIMPNVERAPGLIMLGQLDEYANHGQGEAFNLLRTTRQAPVACMWEGNVAHGPTDGTATWEFIAAFYEAALRNRLNADGTLKPVKLEQGWLSGLYDRAKAGQQTLPIAPYAEFKGDRSTANWLLDAEFAHIWQAYGEKDPRGPAAKLEATPTPDAGPRKPN